MEMRTWQGGLQKLVLRRCVTVTSKAAAAAFFLALATAERGLPILNRLAREPIHSFLDEAGWTR
jgi:hypothetical protein